MDPRELPWQVEVEFPGTGRGQVLLLGGFAAGPENLKPLARRLQARGWSVVVSALGRHTGDEDLFRRSRTWHYYAHGLRLLQRLAANGTGPIVLGGYSTGALIALLLAVRHPSRVAGLVLVSPVLRTARTSTQLVGYSFGSLYYLALPLAAAGATVALALALRRRGWRDRPLAARAAGTAAILGTAALGLRGVTVPLRPSAPMLVDGEPVVPPHFTRASLVTGSTLVPLQVIARRYLGEVRVPTCAVFGADDDVVDVAFGRAATARVPGAEVHVIDGAPHRVIVVHECLDIVEAFVDRAGTHAPARP